MNLLIHHPNQLFGGRQLKKSGHFGMLSYDLVSRLTRQSLMVTATTQLDTLVRLLAETYCVACLCFSLRGMILMRGSYGAWQRQQHISGKVLVNYF
jgi:hypothetical protein